MLRRTLSLVALAALFATGSTVAGAGAGGDGDGDGTSGSVIVCDLEGTGSLSPGVAAAPREFEVTIDLDVTCDNAAPFDTAHLTGSGTGFGGCGATLLDGEARLDWWEDRPPHDGSDRAARARMARRFVSTMSWVATGAARTVEVDGTFLRGPFAGKHFRTVGTIGASDPSQCAGDGITEVTFTEVGVIS